MTYRFLGNSGIKVSALSFGNWANSVVSVPEWNKQLINIVNRCYELGINYFDTSEYYGYGNGEKQYGEVFSALNWKRSSIVVSSKYMWGGEGINNTGLSRKHLMEAVNLSLQRMNLEYLDIAYAHRYDDNTPIEEVCRGFNHIIEEGKAFYWGTSKWKPIQIMKAMECCEKYDLIKPFVEQPEYSLIIRKNVESDLLPFYKDYKLGLTVWSPLCGGILTGKYVNGDPDQSRYKGDKYSKELSAFYRAKYSAYEGKIKEYVEYANELKYSPTQVALAWVLSNSNVSSCIMGCSNVKQVEENVYSLELAAQWKEENNKKLDLLFNTKPS
jgi:voltage-dependent potassium channel beta subunit